MPMKGTLSLERKLNVFQEGLQRLREGRERDDRGEADRRAGPRLHDGAPRLKGTDGPTILI